MGHVYVWVVYKKVLFLFLVAGVLYGDSGCVAILRLCDELSKAIS